MNSLGVPKILLVIQECSRVEFYIFLELEFCDLPAWCDWWLVRVPMEYDGDIYLNLASHSFDARISVFQRSVNGKDGKNGEY